MTHEHSINSNPGDGAVVLWCMAPGRGGEHFNDQWERAMNINIEYGASSSVHLAAS